MFEKIKEILESIWEFIKKIVVKTINFFRNILSWFKDKNRLKELQKNDKLAIVIKDNLTNGHYNVVNCLFDTNTNTLDDTEVVQSKNIDQETRKHFGHKKMIVLS